MQPLLAALPILLILMLMLGARWSAARAGLAGAAAAVGVGVFAFGFPAFAAPALGLPAGLGGASVALAAPFLVASGFRPVEAVTIALIGHSVEVSFGAVGTPVLPQMAATGATGLEIARATGIYHSLLGWLPLAVMAALIQRSTAAEARDHRIWGWAALAFACFVLPYTLLWAFVGPALPTLGGALFGGALLQRASVDTIGGAIASATLRLVPVVVALLAMLTLSRVMVHAGLTNRLALAAAGAAGGVWPAVAPFVGMLGTFVTGSATASNILFTELQRETAVNLGLPVVGVVGAQGFGAAVGNMICPHNVVAAGATVGLQRREGEILRRTLGVTLVYAAAGGVLALWLVR